MENESTNKKADYLYWRKVQREQLGVSANIYMLFSSAILGFLMQFLISRKEELNCVSVIIISFSIILIIVSLFMYGWFVDNRLRDFRKTAHYFYLQKSQDEVSELTKEIGDFTWVLYNYQRILLVFGFFLAIIGISIFIF